ncbi:MAG: hypothetical protein Pars92KO_00220 [Parasphingorhabdus sp.]
MLEHVVTQDRKVILFYLPVVTPWWFENIVVHLIRAIARDHEVHVLVSPLWQNTGIGEEQINLIGDLDHVRWYVLDGPDHPLLRTDASGEDDLFALVDGINPDLVLCRSADIATPKRFPGIVRYIMEGAAPPFRTGSNWISLSPSLFDHGLMPSFSSEQADELDRLAEPLWGQMLADMALSTRAEFLTKTGLPNDKIIIGLPLEYEHEENFFGQHHHYSNNAEMILELASALGDDAILAVTNHPLNELYGDNRAVDAAISARHGQVVMLGSNEEAGHTTLALSQYCDGMIVGNSKSWSACAALGTPILRLSDFATGDWLHAYRDLPTFLADIAGGTARRADPALARRWFAFHLANSVFDPTDPTLDADEIVSRMIQPVDPDRWSHAITRYLDQPLEKAA